MPVTRIRTPDLADNAVTLAKLAALTLKGDLLGHNGSAHVAVPVGANGTLLVADSTQTAGLRWRTLVAGDIPDLSASYVPTTRQVNTTAPLGGGGALSANLTLTVADFVASGASHARGTVPDPGAVAGATKFLREDATWAVPSAGSSSPLTTKGDLWGFSTLDARVPVGADDTFLVASSAAALGVTYRTLTDADIPDTITIANLTQITTRNHSDLQGLTTGDDHTQYTKKGGRTGSTNDTTLSTDASGTLYGSAGNHSLSLIGANLATGGGVRIAGNTTSSNSGLDIDGMDVVLHSSVEGVAKKLAFVDAAGAFETSFRSPDTLPSNLDYILPAAIVTNGYLKTNATGTLSWALVTAAEIGSGAALSRTNDTNVTLTLGGSPTTALLAATSMTLGWSGQLGVSRGGTGADLSGTGGTSQVLKQTSVGGSITVAQLAFTDISGSVTDAQVPDTITLANLTQITTRNHSDLQGLTAGDDHTQYTKIAGRTGTANDTTLSTTVDGTLAGSTLTTKSIRIRPNTADTTTGDIDLDGTVQLWPAKGTPATSETTRLVRFDNSITKSNTSNVWRLIDISPTLSWQTTAGDYAVFNAESTITNTVAPSAEVMSILRAAFGFVSATNAVNPFIPDTFCDFSTITQTAGTSTESVKGSPTVLSSKQWGASGTASYTVSGTTVGVGHPCDFGLEYFPAFAATNTATLVFSAAAAAVYMRAPTMTKAAGATLTLSGRLCGMYLEDILATTPAFTSGHSIFSLGTAVTMQHAGAARFGDTSAPTSGCMLDVIGGTILGNPLTATTFNSTQQAFRCLDSGFTFNGASAGVTALMVGNSTTWLVSSSGSSGGDLMSFNPIIQNTPINTTVASGTWRGVVLQPQFTINSNSDAGGVKDFATTAVRGVVFAPAFARASTNGTITNPEVTAILDSPSTAAGAAFTTRRGHWFRTLLVTISPTNSIALDVEDMTVGTLAAAVRSAIASGTGKYALKLDGTAQSLFGGKITTYNNVATVGNGLPSEVAEIDLTTQAAAIGSTLLYAVPASGAGMYRISYVATVTRAATTSSTLGGANLGVQIDWTDVDDSVSKLSPAGAAVAAGTNTSLATPTNAANTTAASISGCIVVNAKASTNINYRIGYTTSGATTMQYNLHIKCERLAT